MVHKHKLARVALPLVLNILLLLLMIIFRYTWIWLIKNQSGVFSVFQTFLNEIKTQFSSIHALCSDNACKYLSQVFLQSNGIFHQTLVIIDFPPYNILVCPRYLLFLFLSLHVKLYPT